MLTLLTTTGSRPIAWKICQSLMQNQTYSKEIKWIIVDDGEIEQEIQFQKINWELLVIRPKPFWTKGKNTQARNLIAGLELINDDDVVFIIEDDDYYHPNYLEVISNDLDKADLIGHLTNRYYHLGSLMYKELTGRPHSCLNATVIQGQALKIFRQVCQNHLTSIDENLWKKCSNKLMKDYKMVVGLKGIPGRDGIGMYHHNKNFGPVDNDHKIIKEWLGEDIKLYYPLLFKSIEV